MSRSISIAVLLCLAGAVLAVALYAWTSLGGMALSTSGWVALSLGILFTVGLGCGLMALVFYSDVSGADERAGGRRPPADPHSPRVS